MKQGECYSYSNKLIAIQILEASKYVAKVIFIEKNKSISIKNLPITYINTFNKITESEFDEILVETSDFLYDLHIKFASFENFKNRVLEESALGPTSWRQGQRVFNYMDSFYGVAREVQFSKHIDCYYDDSKIDDFLKACYEILQNKIK